VRITEPKKFQVEFYIPGIEPDTITTTSDPNWVKIQGTKKLKDSDKIMFTSVKEGEFEVKVHYGKNKVCNPDSLQTTANNGTLIVELDCFISKP